MMKYNVRQHRKLAIANNIEGIKEMICKYYYASIAEINENGSIIVNGMAIERTFVVEIHKKKSVYGYAFVCNL